MPSYVIEFDSNHGPERRLFTLDDDRNLDRQLFQVLEELRQTGRVLEGAPGDELAVSWNGKELSQQVPLASLSIDTSRPLILRMRPRVVVVETAPVIQARYGLRDMVLPPVEGALGALLAWAIAGLFADLGGVIPTFGRADIFVAILLAGAIGFALSVGGVVRRTVSTPVAAMVTLAAVATGLLMFSGILLAGDSPTVKAFLLARIAGWALVSAGIALVVTAPLRDLGTQRYAEAAVIALCAGLLGALVASLPGVSDLWQGLAFVVVGAMVGAAAISLPVWRSLAVAAVLVFCVVAPIPKGLSAQPVQSTSQRETAKGSGGATLAAPKLVRCAAGRSMPCFEVAYHRPDGASMAATASANTDTSSASWVGTVGQTRLIGPGLIRAGFDSTQVIRLLIAVDVSGSMKGEGIAFTRSALRGFLTSLPGSGIEVAVVPFESRRVAANFAGAKFVRPTDAIAQLEAVPAPAEGNTALYSAVAEGIRKLDTESGAAASVLLVLTDGVNDVGHSRDDPGLLGGEGGREEGRRLINGTGHRVWLVGVGSGVNSAELSSLAGDRARASVISMEPGALLALLASIRLSLASQYTLVYGVPSSVAASLARRPRQLVIRSDSVSLPSWTPPLIASVPFAGVADSALLSPDTRVLANESVSSRRDRLITGLALLAVLLAAYAVLWRISEPVLTHAGAVEASPPAAEADRKSKRDKRGAGPERALRRDAMDAPPRSPSDITNEDAA